MLKYLTAVYDSANKYVDYDGAGHTRTVSVWDTSGILEGTVSKYSFDTSVNYSDSPLYFTDKNTYTIYYCIAKDGYYPAYGSMDLVIKDHEHTAAADWSYNETVHWKECTSATCPATLESEKPEYGDHTFEQIKDEKYLTEKADCEHGNRYHPVCSVCGAIDENPDHIFEDEDSCLNKATHTHLIKKVEAKAPDCVNDGNTAYYECQTCKKSFYTEGHHIIDSQGTEHQAVLRERVSPTCTENGYTEGMYCDICDTWISGHVVIPATGHYFDENTERIITDATCTAPGVKETYCRKCRRYIEQVIDPKGHTEVDVAEVPATCTVDGTTAGKKCSVCGTVISGCEVIPAAHKVITVPAIPETCTTDGYTAGTKCSVCGEILSGCEKITAPGHTEVVLPAVEATCSSTGLTEGKKCSVCDEITVPQQVISKKPHFYGEKGEADPVWEWNVDEDGNWKATVTFTCRKCNHKYVFTPTVEITDKGDKVKLFAEQLFEEAYYTQEKEMTYGNITLSDIQAKTIDGKKKISFKYGWTILGDKDYELVKYGVLYNKDGSLTSPAEETFVLGAAGVKNTTKNNSDAIYTLNVDINNNENLTVYTRGYIVVKDTDGTEYTYYDRLVSTKYTDLLGEIKLSKTYSAIEDSTKKTAFTYDWSALDGYKVVKYGVLYQRADSLEAFADTEAGKFEDRFVVEDNTISRTTKTNGINNYTLKISMKTNKYVATRGYLIVKDSAGTEHTFYSEIAKRCFNYFYPRTTRAMSVNEIENNVGTTMTQTDAKALIESSGLADDLRSKQYFVYTCSDTGVYDVISYESGSYKGTCSFSDSDCVADASGLNYSGSPVYYIRTEE